ncbi:MAG: AraC family transcriptional regulator [Chitinophagaceae bacterium]
MVQSLWQKANGDTMHLHAEDQSGTITMLGLKNKHFSVHYTDYISYQRSVLHSVAENPLLELQFALLNRIQYKQKGVGDVRLEEGQFNIVYAPTVQAEFTFGKGHYTFFNIEFSAEYLARLSADFPVITDFIWRINHNKPGLIRPLNTLGASDLSGIIYRILLSELEPDIKQMYTEAKVLELLITAFQRVAGDKTPAIIRMRPEEVEKIDEVRKFLEENMSEDFTLFDIAHQVGLNEFKIKQGFRQMYSITPFEYLLDYRMEKARELLADQNMSVLDVALTVGYKNVSGFTAAFRKRMGHAPGAVKTKKKQQE